MLEYQLIDLVFEFRNSLEVGFDLTPGQSLLKITVFFSSKMMHFA